MTNELYLTTLSAEEAKEATEAAIRQAKEDKKNVKSKVYEIPYFKKMQHLQYIEKGIREAMAAGEYEYKIHYAARNKKGDYEFSLDFFHAIARAFKEQYRGYFLLVDSGPRRVLTFNWSGKFER